MKNIEFEINIKSGDECIKQMVFHIFEPYNPDMVRGAFKTVSENAIKILDNIQ